jgi:tetratricopeptide (TPR) repeat protein
VIELLLQAERALDAGLLDRADRIYWQAIERDPQNAIAVVGLARVAIERGDERTGYRFALKALEIDPEDLTARRLARRMAEVIEYRGEPLPAEPAEIPAEATAMAAEEEGGERPIGPEAAAGPWTAAGPGTAEGPEAAAGPEAAEIAAIGSDVAPSGPPSTGTERSPGLVARLRRLR